ncbi:hypothetical protein BDW60DRAFT_199039 [Aspergillus nidulans var. acristatus]
MSSSLLPRFTTSVPHWLADCLNVETNRHATGHLDALTNATRFVKYCIRVSGQTCERCQASIQFQVHPSERTHSIIGKEFVSVVTGNSSYVKYW